MQKFCHSELDSESILQTPDHVRSDIYLKPLIYKFSKAAIFISLKSGVLPVQICSAASA